MKRTLIVDKFGSFVGKKSERVRVTIKGEVVEEEPLIRLEQVLLIGKGVSFSTDFVRACVERGIPIVLVSSNGRPYARIISPGLGGTVRTRREQLLAYYDQRGVILSKAFTIGKLSNQANLLKYMAKYRKGRDRELYLAVQDVAIELRVLADEVARLEASNVDELRPRLLNLEGRGADMYWEAIRWLLRGGLSWQGREHRGARDPINSALNYGYGILYSQIEGAILLAGLDPFAGFLHVDRSGKPSLVLDLIEEFRQMVVDRTIFGLLNKGVEVVLDGRGWLADSTRRMLAKKVLERLEGLERYEGKKHRLRVIIQRQAHHIATFVRGERTSYKPFVGGW